MYYPFLGLRLAICQGLCSGKKFSGESFWEEDLEGTIIRGDKMHTLMNLCLKLQVERRLPDVVVYLRWIHELSQLSFLLYFFFIQRNK